MNNDDLERELRSQRGDREAGYTPAPLPMTLDGAPAPGARPSRWGRAGLLVGVGMAGALAAAVVASILTGAGPGPEVGSGNSTEPSAVATSEPTPACGIRDVVLDAEAWGGAAGSRGTVVTVSLAPGRYDCTLAPVTGALITGGGPVGVTVESVTASGAAPGPAVLLGADTAYTVGVTWSNWCGVSVSEPVTLALHFYGWPTPAPVAVAGGGIDPVPPCSGGGETNLSVTDLQAG